MLSIPKYPDSLYFTINKTWNGEPAPEALHTEVWLTERDRGLEIRVHAPVYPNQRLPEAPHDSRVNGLWEYDVVEVFLVGADGKYLEVELGPGGHWLVLGFDGVRQRSSDYADLKPDHRNSSAVEGTWQSIITIPWELVPRPLARLNAFVIAGGEHLAMSPVPGAAPDFHQPAAFPEASLD
jgi:hypothetical protein